MRTVFISLLLISVLTACGEKGDMVETSPTPVHSVAGTYGQLISIQSDTVRAAGYDATLMTMKVQFNNGYTYEYYGIPLELWNSFLAAQPHPWSQVGYPRLVKEKYQYRRIS